MLSATTIRQPIEIAPPDQVSLSILKVLLYFKVFDYPIRKDELFTFVCDNNKINVQAALAKMVNEDLVQIKDDFVWVSNPESIVTKRLEANKYAINSLKKAKKQARILAWLPFIQCICISGSLSKFYMDKESDIDYFIIVDEKRLWLTRFIFSCIIKLLKLAGMEKRFCPNYIITNTNLEINNRNIYTAMEIATLLPVYNHEGYERFLKSNDWVRSYFPYYEYNIAGKVYQYKRTLLHRFAKTTFFTLLDQVAFRFFKRRINRQVRSGKLQVNNDDIIISPDEYKYHIKDHKNTVLHQYSKNVADFSRRYGIELHPIEAI
jgi:hypothetical protein